MTMNKYATIEELLEAVFSMWSVPKLYNENTSRVDSQSEVGGQSQQLEPWVSL
jgi:hypothetical protein